MNKQLQQQPINQVKWIDRNELSPNDYNPNSVAPPELDLLKISILESGWTQPIVINPDMTIVDGFHRWTVSGHDEIFKLTNGLVPTVMITPEDKATQKMATIRHNRARGTHAVLKMSEILTGMVNDGMTGEEIMKRLKMEKDEVVRLLFQAGIPKSQVFENAEFSKSWVPK